MTPEGWTEQKIADVLTRVANAVDVQPHEQYQQIGIRSHAKGLFDKPHVAGVELGNKRVFWVEPDCFVVNIVFAWEQAVGKTTKGDVGKIASHRFPMYRPKNNKADVDFFLYLFKSKYGKHLLTLASPGGAGRNKTLGQSEFNKTVVSVPPLEEQKRIAQILSTWDRAIETVEQLITSAEAQKKALMQQLLTGRKRLPGFSGDWKSIRLENVAEITSSNVDKKTVADQPTVKLCNYTDVYYNVFITQDMDFMEASASPAEIARFSLRKDDVIITKDSESPDDIAIPAYVSEDLSGVLCGYHLTMLRPKANKVSGEFLASVFLLPKVQYYFSTRANGATRFGLSVDAISDAEMMFPSFEEQLAIASVIRAADREILAHRAELKSLQAQRRALMQQLLTGKRRVKLDGGA